MEFTPEVLGVLLNLAIAFIFTSIGIAIFSFLWLRNDWYKIPDFESNHHDKLQDIPENKLLPYIKKIFLMHKPEHSLLFIKRFGFESYFYLQFHGSIGVIFSVCFLTICPVILVYSLITTGDVDMGFEKIVGFHTADENKQKMVAKSYRMLNTILMFLITFITSYSVKRMMSNFSSQLEKVARSIQEGSDGEELQEKANDDYRFIMNTVLLYGCNPADKKQGVLRPYLERLLQQNHIDAKICDMYSPPDYTELAAELIDLEESRIFWHQVWWTKYIGKCMYRRLTQQAAQVQRRDRLRRIRAREDPGHRKDLHPQ